MRVEQPVLLADEVFDFLLTVYYHARGDRLHASGGQPGFNLAPEERRELIAHYAVEYAPRLLCVHKVLVYLARVLYALRDNLFRYLVEGHAPRFLIVEVQQLLEVP